jgi:subtilase-type serine protease
MDVAEPVLRPVRVSRHCAAYMAAGAVASLLGPPAQAQSYVTLDYGANGTILTGIRGDTITGHYLIPGSSESGGLLYDLSTGTWTAFPTATAAGANFPGAITSSSYGPSFGSQYGILNVVGTYKTPSSWPYNLSYLYNGAVPPGEQLTTLAYPSGPGATTLSTNAHSTFGNQVVGSYTTEEQSGKVTNAFIYNINTGTYETNDFPGAISTTAYGIWGNLITGGYTAPGPHGYVYNGYIYNETTGVWTSVHFPGALATHFEGISGGGRSGTYNLATRWVSLSGETHAAVLHIDGNGGHTWIPLAVPGASATTANSVYDGNVIGVYNDFGRMPSGYQGYVVNLPGIYNPIQNTGSLDSHTPNVAAITGMNGDDIVNTGTIQTTGARNAGIESGAAGVVTNNGTIKVFGPYSAGVQMNGSYGTLLNEGSIIAGPGAYAIQTGQTAIGTVVVNDGGIDGQVLVAAANTRFENSGFLGISTPGAGITQLIGGTFVQTTGGTLTLRVAPDANDMLKVTGTAMLGGTLNVNFASGSYLTKQYDLVQSGGLNGTTFAAFTTGNLPANFAATLSYTATDAILNLTAALGQPTPASPAPGLNLNQQNVAASLNNFFNSGGAMPPGFANLFVLTGNNLADGLSQADGEVAVDGEIAAFQMMTQFLGVMLDPFVDGRLGGFAAGDGEGALDFAPDAQTILPPDVALAFAGVLKAPPAPFAQRWTAWSASYGGGNWTNGNAAAGSNNLTAQTFGFAAGMDFHYSPDTIFGFALGGGGTGWSLSNGLGTGTSDAFQTGVYGITRAGSAYVAAALAVANHWMTTNRTAVGDALTANFAAQSYGARIEAGYRYAVPPTLGVTPYAAVQAQDFHTPSYIESDVTGGGFGLSYAAMNATDVRTELGGRFDEPAIVASTPLLLRARVAWAHDFVGNPSLNAVFESLPGASFVVDGAPMPRDSALTSAGAEVYLTRRFSLLAKFEGEFAAGSQTYAGTGTLRYTW